VDALAVVLAVDRSEDAVGIVGQLFGDDDGLGDRFGDPPVLDGQVGVAFLLGGGDRGGAVVLDHRALGDLVDYWWKVLIPTMRYSSPKTRT
jgi:hypothetical protein